MSLHDNRATGQHLVVLSRRAGLKQNDTASRPTNHLLCSLKNTGEQQGIWRFKDGAPYSSESVWPFNPPLTFIILSGIYAAFCLSFFFHFPHRCPSQARLSVGYKCQKGWNLCLTRPSLKRDECRFVLNRGAAAFQWDLLKMCLKKVGFFVSKEKKGLLSV